MTATYSPPAFAVAKDVRTHTDIGSASISMAAAAVKLAERIFPSIADQRLLLIGAGEMQIKGNAEEPEQGEPVKKSGGFRRNVLPVLRGLLLALPALIVLALLY